MLSARRVSYLEAEFHLQVAVEYTLCIFFPQESVSVIDCICVYMNLLSISGIFIRLMKVRDIKLGGLGEWFSGRNSKTGRDFLCLLIFSWAWVFRS